MAQNRIPPVVDESIRASDTRVLAGELRDFYDGLTDVLDDDRIECFPSYFIDDCIYQVVSRENYAEGLPQAAMYCDGIAMVRDRVTALRETQVYVPRLWRHFLSGLRITAVVGGAIHVRVNFMITEAMSAQDRKSVVWGKSVSVRVDHGGRGILQKKRNRYTHSTL